MLKDKNGNHVDGEGNIIHMQRPPITPEMLEPVTGKERILISSVTTVMRKLRKPLVIMEKVRGVPVPVKHWEIEHELKPRELRWEQWPIPESFVDKGLADFCRSIKQELRDAGIMK